MDPIQKQLINPIKDGGAPFYGSDFLDIQKNAKSGYSAFMQELVNKSGTTEEGTGGNRSFKNGVWVVEPSFTPVNPAQWDIGEGYFFADGELVYYPGGSYNLEGTGGSYKSILIGVDSTTTKEARVFKDGFSYDINETFSRIEIETVNSVSNGWFFPPSLDVNKQYVIISNRYDDKVYPNVKGSLGITALENELLGIAAGQTTNWVSLTLTGATGILEYKRDYNGNVFLRGDVTAQDQGLTGTITIATLPSGFRPTGNIEFYGGNANGAAQIITVASSGQIKVPLLNTVDTRAVFGGVSFPNN